MAQSSGGSFGNIRAILIGLVLLGILIPGYHRLLKRSIQRHPEVIQQTVVEHCRFTTGKLLGKVAAEDVAVQMEGCKGLRWTDLEVAGGVLDAVFIKITLAPHGETALAPAVLIFKQAEMNPRSLNLASSLSHLISGQWAFNHFNTYSEGTFSGSF